MTWRSQQPGQRRRSGGYRDAPPPEASVGEVIRHARERRGESRETIAELLRIKADYLAAIEAGDAEALPGQAYASGFVRAYAGYLDLDSEEMVRRFKQEGAVGEARQPLAFPAPAPERQVPVSAVLATVVLLAAAGVGGWQYYQATRDVAAQPAPALPADLVGKLENGTAVADAESAEPPAVQMADLEKTGASAGSVDAAPSPAPTGTGAALAAQPPRPVPAAGAASQRRAAAASGSAATVSSPAGGPAESDPGATGQAAATASSGNQAAALPAQVRQDAERILGSPAGEGRIGLLATSDSWIQVKAADGSVLISRVLRAGQAYRVPPRDGLTLVTGNAGGLAVYVDGERGAELGGAGEVRRDIPLTPQRLAQGDS